MRPVWFASALVFASTQLTAQTPKPFTIQQVLSAPYALSLTAAPVGNRFAWVENAEGRRNIWIGSPTEPARHLTHHTEDDAQDISGLTWSPDATSIAYTYGAEDGADGHPANPANLQRPTALEILLQPLAPNAPAITIGEGTNPLFTPDGRSLLFLRNGNIWIANLDASPSCPDPQNCHPERSLAASPRGAVEGPATQPVPAQLPVPSNHQLVFDRGRASNLTLSPDGHLLAFITHRRGIDAPAHAFLALFNLTTHELTFPTPSTANDSAPTFSPDGHHLAWLRTPFTREAEYTPHLTSPNPWSIQLLDLATNTIHQVYSPEPNKPGSAIPHLSSGEPHVLWAQSNRIIFFSEQSGFVHPFVVAAEGGEPRDVMRDQIAEVEDAVVSKDGKSLIYASAGPLMNCVVGNCNRNYPLAEAPDVRTVWKVDLDATQPHVFPVPLTPEGVIATHPAQLADGTLAALVSSAVYPMHPAIVVPKSVAYVDEVNKPLPLRQSFGPDAYPAKSMVEPVRVDFNATGAVVDKWPMTLADPVTADPDHIHAQLFLPPHLDPTHRHATLIFVHGGPNRQMLLGYPGMDYYSNAYAMNQYLTSRGFIVLSVNYRGGIGYGLKFREAEHYGPDGGSEYNDVLAAVKYLRTRTDVDPARIGIWGGSYGGYLTALALARNSDLFAAGVDFHGVHEWSLEGNPDRWMTDPTHATAAQRDAAAALAHSSSPMADVDHWRSPVLLIHGDNDPEVNYAQSPTLADALRPRGVHVEELIFPDEVHGFLLHKDWIAAYEATAAFFEKVLKP